MYDGYEMNETHRSLLTKHRVYLLHNMHPTEVFWSTLIAKEILSSEMVDEIKSLSTTTERLGRLLDLLPTRGPEAFDQFCEALLECDHSYVAEYIKTVEATDKFRTEIDAHCGHFSDNLTDKFVKIFKRNTPVVQRFAERKFELLLEEQARDIEKKEEELKEFDTKNMLLQLEVSQLRSFLNSCYETSESLMIETQRDQISRAFLREESKHLENLKTSLKDIAGFEKVCKFYTNIQEILTYLEEHNTGTKVKDKPQDEETKTRQVSTRGRTLQDKMLVIANLINQVGEDLGQQVNVPGIRVRTELEKLNQRFKEVVSDITAVREVFRSSMRQKRKLEGEVLSMLHNFQEIRRLDRELKEKHSHVMELQKEAQMVKKKVAAGSRQSRRLSQQIEKNLEKKKHQMKDTEQDLATNIASADQRLLALLNLLPDLEETSNEFLRSDTEMTSDVDSHNGSRLGTPLGVVRPTSSILANHTYRKIADTMGKHARQGDQVDYHSDQVTETVPESTLIVQGQSKETEIASPRKAKLEVARQASVSVTQPKTNAVHRDRIHSHRKSAIKRPETYNKEDVDRWLAEQDSNEHIHNLHKKVALLNAADSGSRPVKIQENEKMDTIRESAREVKQISKSGHTLVTRMVSVKDTWHPPSTTSPDNEKSHSETKNSSASSGNSHSSVPGCVETEEQSVVKVQMSRSFRRNDVTASRDRFLSSSSDKFILDTGEGHLTSRRRRQSKSFAEQNVNVIIETETQDLATPVSRGRKEKESENRAKIALQSSRELLQTKRIDLSLPNGV